MLNVRESFDAILSIALAALRDRLISSPAVSFVQGVSGIVVVDREEDQAVERVAESKDVERGLMDTIIWLGDKVERRKLVAAVAKLKDSIMALGSTIDQEGEEAKKQLRATDREKSVLTRISAMMEAFGKQKQIFLSRIEELAKLESSLDSKSPLEKYEQVHESLVTKYSELLHEFHAKESQWAKEIDSWKVFVFSTSLSA